MIASIIRWCFRAWKICVTPRKWQHMRFAWEYVRQCDEDNQQSAVQLDPRLNGLIEQHARRFNEITLAHLPSVYGDHARVIDECCRYLQQEIGLTEKDARSCAAQLVNTPDVVDSHSSDIARQMLEEISCDIEGLDKLQQAEVYRRIAFRCKIYCGFMNKMA